MKTVSSAKYLGDIVSAKGGSHDTIEKRRSEGWGRISQIMGLISEVTSSDFRVQIGLKLRESKLCSGLLCNSEAWSSIYERDMTGADGESSKDGQRVPLYRARGPEGPAHHHIQETHVSPSHYHKRRPRNY